MSVWDVVVGQRVLPTMQRAVDEAHATIAAGPATAAAGKTPPRRSATPTAAAMTHAWLIAGPPGSGRSVLARAFAAALQCPDRGCGECQACRSVRSGTHPDVTVVATEGLSIGVDRVRDLVRAAAMRPVAGRWQVVLVEDADRLTDEAVDAMLLSIEEPPPRTVWVMCVPSAEEIAPTIRSRSRLVQLRTPPADAVAGVLRGEGVPEEAAVHAARASLGHVGRARGLATDEQARERRAQVLRLPQRLDSLAEALDAAAKLVSAAEADAEAHCDELDEREVQRLTDTSSMAQGRRALRVDKAALSELQKEQKRRRTRVKRDSLDRALVDVLALYRDVLLLQLLGEDAEERLFNPEMLPSLGRLAARTNPVATIRCIEALTQAREALEANASPLLALESLAVTLAREGRAA
jgi:DNA polymerase-3 subunit delta'